MAARSLFTSPPAELQALLRAVKDVPGEDAPRLVLADWLEEHGTSPAETARAELIRLQCAGAQLPWSELPPEQAEWREQELWKRHRRAWLGPLTDVPGYWECVRGLLRLNTGDPWGVLRVLARPLPDAVWAWVEGLELSQWTPAVTEQLARLPALAGIRTLDFYNCRIGLRGVRALARSPHLGALEALALGGNRVGRAARKALKERFGQALIL
jgi:uncharacterized protein (TIGR02996 family)